MDPRWIGLDPVTRTIDGWAEFVSYSPISAVSGYMSVS